MRKLLSALTVPTGLALLIVPVQAQDAPPSPSIGHARTLSPGQSVILADDGAPPGAIVLITLDRTPARLAVTRHWAVSSPGAAGPIVGRAVAAANGSFRSSVTIPPGTGPGRYSLVFATGSKQLARIALQVEASSASVMSGLLFDSADLLPGLLAGASLIVAGGLLLLGVQYRRSRIA
jgi:hypothetical protein